MQGFSLHCMHSMGRTLVLLMRFLITDVSDRPAGWANALTIGNPSQIHHCSALC